MDRIHSQRDWSRIARYVAGEGDPAEREQLEAWIDADTGRRRLAAELLLVWEMTGDSDFPETDAAWRRFEAKLAAVSGPPRSTAVRDRRWGRRRWSGVILGLAAGLAAVIGAFGLFDAPGSDPPALAFELETGIGERERVRLPDGSEVTLNPGSRLEVDADFATGHRRIRLAGEGFFSVTEDQQHPFIVSTENAVVRVLGTRFGVSAYQTDDRTHIIVASGRVAVVPGEGIRGGNVELGPAQRAQIDRVRNSMTVDSIDLAVYLLEQQGQLVFRDVTLAEVLDELQRWYDVELEVRDPVLANRRIRATFEDDPLGDVLHAIALAADATYSVEDRTVTFEPSAR